MVPPKRPKERVVLEMKAISGEKIVELPFITTVLSDLFGDTDPETHFDERELTEVRDDRQVRALFDRINPTLNLELPDPDDPKKKLAFTLNLKGGSGAFDPENVAQAIEPLANDLKARQRLKALRDALGKDRKLTEQFAPIAQNPEAARVFLQEVAGGADLSGAVDRAVSRWAEKRS